MGVTAFDEEVAERLAYLVGLHASVSLPADPSVPGAIPTGPSGPLTARESSGRSRVHRLVGRELGEQVCFFPPHRRNPFGGGVPKVAGQITGAVGRLPAVPDRLSSPLRDLDPDVLGRDSLDRPSEATLYVPTGGKAGDVATEAVDEALHRR